MKVFVFTVLFTSMLITMGLCQTQITESDSASIIPKIMSGYLDFEVVSLIGQIDQWSKENQRSSDEYIIKNRWGQPLVVKTAKQKPIPGRWYLVTGMVSISNRTNNMRFLVEIKRDGPYQSPDEITMTGGISKVIKVSDEQKKLATRSIKDAENAIDDAASIFLDLSKANQKLNSAKFNMSNKNYPMAISDAKTAEQIALNAPFSVWLYLLAVVVIIILLFILAITLRKYFQEESKRQSKKFEELWSIVEESIKTKDIPIHDGGKVEVSEPSVQNKTLVILPFHLTMQHNGKEDMINFYVQRGDPITEFTFGRNPGEKLKHIRIEHPTVSHDQAKIIWEEANSCARLYNKASGDSNPTIVNGNPLKPGESCELHDNDEIMMGVVKLYYHSGVV